VVLRTARGITSASDVDDLHGWLRGLTGCPPISETFVAHCRSQAHADGPATWFYVEPDPVEGLLRRRCLACGLVASTMDSEERWTFPTAWSCGECTQPIAEVAFGLNFDNGRVAWVAVAVRCVNCGAVSGVTDLFVSGLTYDEVVAAL